MQTPRKTSIVCAAKSSYTWNKSGRKLKLFRGSVLLMFIYLYLFSAVLKITCRILAAQTIEVFWGGSIQKVNHSLSWTSFQCSVRAIVWLGSEFRAQPASTSRQCSPVPAAVGWGRVLLSNNLVFICWATLPPHSHPVTAVSLVSPLFLLHLCSTIPSFQFHETTLKKLLPIRR